MYKNILVAVSEQKMKGSPGAAVRFKSWKPLAEI
jgi:hypothetical protein